MMLVRRVAQIVAFARHGAICDAVGDRRGRRRHRDVTNTGRRRIKAPHTLSSSAASSRSAFTTTRRPPVFRATTARSNIPTFAECRKRRVRAAAAGLSVNLALATARRDLIIVGDGRKIQEEEDAEGPPVRRVGPVEQGALEALDVESQLAL